MTDHFAGHGLCFKIPLGHMDKVFKTRSAQELYLLRVKKGYGYDRLSFLESWDSPWSEVTWKRWELGTHLPRWEHLKTLVQYKIIEKDSDDFHRIKKAIEEDWAEYYQTDRKKKIAVSAVASVLVILFFGSVLYMSSVKPVINTTPTSTPLISNVFERVMIKNTPYSCQSHTVVVSGTIYTLDRTYQCSIAPEVYDPVNDTWSTVTPTK